MLYYNKQTCLAENPWHHISVSMDILCSHVTIVTHCHDTRHKFIFFNNNLIALERQFVASNPYYTVESYISTFTFNIFMLHKPILSILQNLGGFLSLTHTTGKILHKIINSLYCVCLEPIVHDGDQTLLVCDKMILFCVYSKTTYRDCFYMHDLM